MRKLSEKEYQELLEREQKGEKLSDEENLLILLYLGYSEDIAREMLFIDSDEFKNSGNIII
ncbi:MAG: hypothetical protein HND39_01810 [Ignavibacteriota bacterium]|jgi:helix-turn-helix protein|nr:hypothetical protein [Ignavibacteriota bacterium]MCE7856245.1 hypothetical protein [Ignavibacteria bacterium CHB3]MEB2297679.1 hypothetical protein [Ignavibacteria bacterium]NUM61303.1 hypothetical protein [Ignavibacteriaceae bacterium]QKJ95099.1 MAG: hypothetical protein HND39_01810 [Ignavibacteriota bacterium]